MKAIRSAVMKQFGLGLILSTKKIRKTTFLDDMERVVPWAALVEIVGPRCSGSQE